MIINIKMGESRCVVASSIFFADPHVRSFGLFRSISRIEGPPPVTEIYFVDVSVAFLNQE